MIAAVLEFVDLNSVHWPSAIVGIVLLFGMFYAGAAAACGVCRLTQRIRRRRGAESSSRAERAPAPILDGTAAEDDPLEGAYTVPDMDARGRRGYRRMLGDIFAERPIRHAPREVPLSPEESRDLWYTINGDKAL